MQAAALNGDSPPQIVAEDREVTRLGESVFQEGKVSPEALDHSCRVLERMAETLRREKVAAFRAAATSAIRDARNQEEFLDRARQALSGVSVEIISGQEEARLIHLGVRAEWPDCGDNIVVIDIGGGSAEIIESIGGEVSAAYSKPLGAVRLTGLFFRSDPPTTSELRQFKDYVHEKLASIPAEVGSRPYDRVIATAATAAAVVRAIHRIPSSERETTDRLGASTEQVRELFETLSSRSLRERQAYPGIGAKRAEIVIAGCGALALILERLGAESAYYSSAGVRDGMIADLAQRRVGAEGARLQSDQRRTVREMAGRYGVSMSHADHAAKLVSQLFDELEPLHRLEPNYGRLLEASAYLHDIGHFVSDSRHHRHSYYLVEHSDLPGFTDRERLFIANLCRYHRKNMPRSSQENYKALEAEERQSLLTLIPLLRLADSLDRAHEQRVDSVKCSCTNGEVRLALTTHGNAELEEWAAAQHAEVFEQIYQKSLVISTS